MRSHIEPVLFAWRDACDHYGYRFTTWNRGEMPPCQPVRRKLKINWHRKSRHQKTTGEISKNGENSMRSVERNKHAIKHSPWLIEKTLWETVNFPSQTITIKLWSDTLTPKSVSSSCTLSWLPSMHRFSERVYENYTVWHSFSNFYACQSFLAVERSAELGFFSARLITSEIS